MPRSADPAPQLAAAETAAYPRTYGPALWVRAVGLLLAAFFAGGGAFLAVMVLSSWRRQGTGALSLGLAVALGLIGGGVAFLLATFRSKIVLDAERIAVRQLWRARALARADIAGRRRLQLQYGQVQVRLCPRDGALQPLKLSWTGMKRDAVLENWVNALPDLDQQDVAAAEAEIAADAELGQTPEERLGRVASGKKLATAFAVCTWGLAGWGWLYPSPYELVLAALALLPWVALAVVAQSHGLYRLDKARNDIRPDFSVPFMLPGFVLLLRAVLDLEVEDLRRALLYAACVSAVLTGAAMRSDARLRRRALNVGGWFVLLGVYGYGVVVLADREFDYSPGRNLQARVLSGYVTHDRHGSTYHLRLSAWGSRGEGQAVSVPASLYRRAGVGTAVCIHEGRGALGIAWFVVHGCG